MKRSLIAVLLLLAGAVFLTQCKHEPPNPGNDNPGTQDSLSNIPTLSDTCSLDTIYFMSEILPIFKNNCATSGCHDANSAKDGVILDSYVNIIRTGDIEAFDVDAGDIYEVITETDPDKVMPPGGKLSPEQINAIRIWINQGALNNSCRNKCFSDSFSFSKEIWPIVQGSCTGCHRRNNPAGGVSLADYNDIKTAVDNGSFEGSIFHKSGWKPMPPGGSLDSCSQAKIRNWLDAGAPNN